jgi:hypothetical protein
MPKKTQKPFVRLSPAASAERDRRIAKLWLAEGLSAAKIGPRVGLSHQGVIYRLRALRLDREARERYQLSRADAELGQ